MALDGTRLKNALATDILAAIQSAFPIDAALQAAEKTKLQNAQSAYATAIANGTGPDIVSEITGHASVPAGIAVATTGTAAAQTGSTQAAGTVA